MHLVLLQEIDRSIPVEGVSKCIDGEGFPFDKLGTKLFRKVNFARLMACRRKTSTTEWDTFITAADVIRAPRALPVRAKLGRIAEFSAVGPSPTARWRETFRMCRQAL